MTKDLQTRIDERKARLAALDLERASLLGEIRAYGYCPAADDLSDHGSSFRASCR